jgi:hypothetical protein
MAVMLLSAKSGFSQQVTIPEGTVIELRMDTGLNSQDSHVDETLKATQDRRLNDAWTSIQSNLRQLNLDERLSTR